MSLGCSDIGKTPMACCIAMGLSDFHIKDKDKDAVPSFRTTSHLDFLRGEVGSKTVPIIFDDGNVKAESIASLKAFLDVCVGGGSKGVYQIHISELRTVPAAHLVWGT